MTRLDWSNAPRRYESGVDRGVLYPAEGPGVPWNGLTNVEESSVGGDAETYYFDGIKYLEKTNPKNFKATITAFSAPSEFASCMGELPVIPGFILTRQPKKRFGFSYRTMVGGEDYKLHLVYNATATQSSKSYSTVSDSPSPSSFTWEVDAVPPKASGFRPSAHFVLDSTKTDLFTLRAVEDILYGTSTREPRLPTAEELVDIVGLWDPQLIVPAVEPPEETVNLFNQAGNPDDLSYTWGGYGSVTSPGSVPHYSGATARSRCNTETYTSEQPAYNRLAFVTYRQGYRTALGAEVVVSLDVYLPSTLTPISTDIGPIFRDGVNNDSSAAEMVESLTETYLSELPRDEWVTLSWRAKMASTRALDAFYISFYVDELEAPNHAEQWMEMAAPILTEGGVQISYFSGDTPDDLEYTYEWTGTPHASTSVRKTRPVAYLTPGLGDLTPSKVPGIYHDLPTTRLVETPTRVVPEEVLGEAENISFNPRAKLDLSYILPYAGGEILEPISILDHPEGITTGVRVTTTGGTGVKFDSKPGSGVRTTRMWVRRVSGPSNFYPVFSTVMAGPLLYLPDGEWIEFDLTVDTLNTLNHPGVRASVAATGAVIEVTGVVTNFGPNPTEDYFDGDSSDTDDIRYTYAWTGTPHASTSVRREMKLENLGLYRLEQ